MKFTANCLYCDIPNANGILFPRAVVKAAVEEYQRHVEAGRAIGELKDAEIDNYDRVFSVSMDKVTHKFDKVEMVDDHVECSGVILNTPCGKTMQTLIKSIEGISFSISPVLVGDLLA